MKPPSDPYAHTGYTVEPAAPVTTAEQLNVPVLLVSPQLVGESVRYTGASVIEIVAPPLTVGVNPVPLTVTVVPLGPWLGVSVIAGVVIVNGAVALSKLPSDPVAVTVYAVDEAVPVIVTVQLNVPVLLVSPQLVGDNVGPPEIDNVTEIVAVEEVGVNPLPLTVTDVPLGPWLGVRVITGGGINASAMIAQFVSA